MGNVLNSHNGIMKNMTIDNIAKAVNGTIFNNDDSLKDITASGVVIDSRQVEKNFVFIAIKGERVDGHNFIDDVFNKGALCVICEKRPESVTKPVIVVESSTEALKKLAAFYRAGLDIKLIGITGSVGKTSTKEFIASVLAEKYSVLKTEGNFNNEIGLPLTILRIRDYHEIAVIEMGISHFGDMKPLGEIAKPDICVITNIGYCHLEYLKDRDGVLKEKTDMFNYAAQSADYVLNGDDDKLNTITSVRGKSPIFVSIENRQCPVHVENIIKNNIEGSICEIALPENELIKLNIPIPGKHMISNALIACAVGKLCDVSSEQMSCGIEKLKPVGGRVNILKTDDYTIIDDCYNANPVSMKASIDVLKYADTRKVAILGDMFELGSDEAKLHGDIGEYVASTNIDVLITVGNLSQNIKEEAIKCGFRGDTVHYTSLEKCIDSLESVLNKDDTILIKASHGMHLENIINLLTK